MPSNACFYRFRRILLLTVTLGSLVGCASTPPPSPESRLQMGRVGVCALAYPIGIEFQTFAKGWATGAAKGGAFGLVDGLLSALGETLRNPPSGPYAGPAFLITTLILATVNTVVYSTAGGLEAVPTKTASRIEQDLQTAFREADLAKDLAREIVVFSGKRADITEHAITTLDLPMSDGPTAYAGLPQKGIDTVLEVRVTEAGFRGGHGSQPDVRFYLDAHIRLVATENGAEIYTRDFQYLSREQPFYQWFAEGSQELRGAFNQAILALTERIVDEVFIVTEFPFASGLWALPGQPEFGSCWFRPINPEAEYTSLWYAIRHNQPGIHIKYTSVPSRQPLLQWEEFPRPRDRTPENAAILRDIADVSYDLKIWEARNDYPERLVHDIRGLQQPQYRPDLPLKAKAKYFWTFRARYRLAGKLQVSRWAFSSIPSNVPSDYPLRHPGGTCDLDNIPNTNYYRFATP